MSDTCNLFPLFGDPWPSCLLPSQREERPVVIIPTLSLHREGSESCLYGNRGDMWSLALSTESNMLDATGRRLFTSQDPTKQAGPSTMTFREEAGLLALQAQLSLIAQSCPTLCDPMDCSMPGFPVHHQLPELAQTHVHQVGDAIQNISSSVLPFSSCLQSFPASGSFQMSQFFALSGQSIAVSASASVLPLNIQDWFPLGWTGLISLQSKGLKSLLQHHSSKAWLVLKNVKSRPFPWVSFLFSDGCL